MEPVSEELVIKTSKELAGLSPAQLSEIADRAGMSQPAVLSFISELTGDLDRSFRELCTYIFIVIYHMFENGYGKDIPEISPEEIIESFENNEELIGRMDGTYDKFYENIARVQMSAQPYVIKYVFEVLFEASQGEAPVLFSEEDMSYLFLILKSIIDAVNEKTGN